MALCCVLEQDIFQFLSPHRYIHVNGFQLREFNMLGIDNSAINYTVASYPGGSRNPVTSCSQSLCATETDDKGLGPLKTDFGWSVKGVLSSNGL